MGGGLALYHCSLFWGWGLASGNRPLGASISIGPGDVSEWVKVSGESLSGKMGQGLPDLPNQLMQGTEGVV